MKTKIDPQWHVLAAVAALIVLGLRGGTILEHQAWNAGSETVLGKIESVQASRKVTVVRYAYVVDGKPYGNEEADRKGGMEGMPRLVTYAKNNPAVSTINPDSIESKYTVSIVLCGLVLSLVGFMWLFEIFGRRKAPEATA